MSERGTVSARKGMEALGVVITMLVLVAVAAVLFYFLGKGSSAGNSFFTCDTSDPQYICVAQGGGCPSTHSRAYTKLWGCPAVAGISQMCCQEKSPPPGVASSPVPRARMQAYRLDIRPAAGGGLEIKDRTPLREGDAIPVIAGFPVDIMIEAQVEDCSMCDVTVHFRDPAKVPVPGSASFTFKIENEAGVGALPRVADRLRVDSALKAVRGPDDLSTQPDILTLNIDGDPTGSSGGVHELRGSAPYDTFMADKNFRLQFEGQDAGETFTLTGKLKVEYEHIEGDPKSAGVKRTTQVLEEDVTVRFQVKSGVRYGSLTQKWEQSKRLFAMCEDPVVCDEIYYLIIGIPGNPTIIPTPGVPGPLLPITPPTVCPDLAPLLASSPARKIEDVTRYYVVDETGRRIVPTAFPDLNACVTSGMGSISDPGYAAAYNLFMQNVGSGTIPPEVGVLFRNSLNKMSRVSCQADVDPAEGIAKPFLANHPDPSVKRWEFTLDKPYMQDLYLCVYGKSSSGAVIPAGGGPPAPLYYSAGKPQQIKIDRTAPVAGINTDSFGTHLTFTCEDSGSGCEDYRQIAYISDFEGYLGALFSGQAQSATLWCPDYRTSRGYSLVRGQEMAYFDPVVRAMCLRVVDKAGNAGVTLSVVGWPMFLTDLTVRKVLEKYASEPGRRP